MAQLPALRRIVVVIAMVAVLFVVGAARGQTPARNGPSAQTAAGDQGRAVSNLDPVDVLVDGSVDRGVHADVLEQSGAAAESDMFPREKQGTAAVRHWPTAKTAMSPSSDAQSGLGPGLHSIAPASGSVNLATMFSGTASGSPLASFGETDFVSPSAVSAGEYRIPRSRWRQREELKRRANRKLQTNSHPQGASSQVSALNPGLLEKKHESTGIDHNTRQRVSPNVAAHL